MRKVFALSNQLFRCFKCRESESESEISSLENKCRLNAGKRERERERERERGEKRQQVEDKRINIFMNYENCL